MSSRRLFRTIHIIVTYLVIFSMLASPAASRRVAIAAPQAGPAAQAATATVTLTKSDSHLIDVDNDGLVDAGDTLRYTLTATNTGEVDAAGVTLQDVLGPNLELVEGSLRTTPLAYRQVVELLEDGGLKEIVLGGADFDQNDSNPLSFQTVSDPTHGVLGGAAPNLTYLVNTPHYFGPDSFSFKVCNGSAPTDCDSAVVEINVLPVNDAPSFTITSSTEIHVDEDSAQETVEDWASSISAGPANEAGQELEFVVTNDNNVLFAVQPAVSADGTLTFTPASNQFGVTTVTVTLKDDGGTENGGKDTSAPHTFVIVIDPINDAPSFKAGPNQTVAEDAGAQTVTNWATEISPGPFESGQAVSFEVTGNTNTGLFVVQPMVSPDGTLTYTPAPDAVGKADITLVLRDDGGTANGGVNASQPQTFTITVEERNDAPVVNPATFTVDENSPAGTQVGQVTYSDIDQGQPYTFAIIAGNTGGAFNIDPASGWISVANPAALDFETTPTFSLTVKVTDSGSPPAEGTNTITVNLNDKNDAPSISPATFELKENSAVGTVVGKVTYSDQDAGQTLTFTIDAGNTGGAFAIDADGNITVANAEALNFETNPTFTLTVTVTDNAATPASSSAQVIVNLTNDNEAPTVADERFTVAEHSPNGTLVGKVTVTDPDAGQTHTFEITNGNTDGAFAIDADGKITVANSNAIKVTADFSSFTLTITATDNGSPALSGQATVTVDITNVNDAPVVDAASFNVNENSPAGTEVGTVTFNDADPGQTHTFAITAGNEGGEFDIHPTTGVITVSSTAKLDYESTNTYSLVVTVQDNIIPPASGSATITINVVDQNDAPVIVPQVFSVPENSPAGTSVGQVDFTDQDAGQTHSFAITNGNLNNAFAINASTGEITVADPDELNYEANSSFILTVQVTDSGSPVAEGTNTITINLSDVNEAPVIDDGQASIKENLAKGELVYQISLFEPDTAAAPAQTHLFEITGSTPANPFAINNSGQITVNNSATLDFETNPTFTLTVKVTDSGSPALSDTATITINLENVNEAPTTQGESYQAAANTLLQVASAPLSTTPLIFVQGNLLDNDDDPDGSSTLTAVLDSASPGAVVTISPNGEFTYVPPAGATSDSFTYRVVDEGGLFTTATVSITLLGRVWYVQNNAQPGGLGRSTDPFDTLAEAEAASLPGDTIYVFSGDGTAAGLNTTGITLKHNQRLLGAGVALELPVSINGSANPIQLLPAGQQPLIGSASGPGVKVTGISAEVRGLSVGGSPAIQASYNGATGGTLVVSENTIRDAAGNGIDLQADTTGVVTAVVTYNVIGAAGDGFYTLVNDGDVRLDYSNNTAAGGNRGVSITNAGGELTITGFANNHVGGERMGGGVVIDGATFDPLPGDASDTLNFYTFSAGTVEKPVDFGLSITNALGSIGFSSLEIHASGDGLKLSGTTAEKLMVGIPDGQGSISALGGQALDLDSVEISAPNLALVSANSPKDGISVVRTIGWISTTAGSAISNPALYAVYMADSSAHLAFNGSITSSGMGVLLTNNPTGKAEFNGGLTLNTGENPGFVASMAGTVTALGINTIATTTGTALSVKDTNIGSAGLTFQSISADGAWAGIELVNTGTDGGLTVTGTGVAGSGGTIANTLSDGVRLQNTRNVSLSYLNINNAAKSVSGFPCSALNASGCNAGVDINNSRNITLSSLNLDGSGQIGINVYKSSGLTIDGVTVEDAGNSAGEFALLLHNVFGSLKVENSAFTNASEGGIHLYKDTADLLDMALSQVTVNGNNPSLGEDGFQFYLYDQASVNILIENSTFSGQRRNGIEAIYDGLSTLNMTVRNSLFEENQGAGEMIFTGLSNGAAKLTLEGNTIKNRQSTGIVMDAMQYAGLDAKVLNNTIGHTGSTAGGGIQVRQMESSVVTVLVDNNTINGVFEDGISGTALAAGSGMGTLHATVTNNNVGTPSNGSSNGVNISSQDARNEICLDVRGNMASGNTAGIRVYNLAGTFRVESGTPLPNLAAVTSLINSTNTSTPAAIAGAGAGRTISGASLGSCRDAVGAAEPAENVAQTVQPEEAAGRVHGLAQLLSAARLAQLAENTVQVNIGTLLAKKSVTITFDVVISDPLPQGVYQVSNQATLSGSNFDPLVSDDPATTEVPNDATVTLLYSTPTAVDDVYTVNEDTPLTVLAPGVLSNDQSSSGYPLTAKLNSAPTWGAVILNVDGGFIYIPSVNDNGARTFTYLAYDGDKDSNPAVVTVNVLPVNDAPLLNAPGVWAFARQVEGDPNNTGTLIRDFLAGAGDPISDVDDQALEGIAITAADSAHGKWQYTTDGVTWQDLGSPAETEAWLLAADTNTRLRFIAQPGFTGVINPAITFRAWDQTSGTNGGTADVTTNGGTTAFSTAFASASIEIYAQADLSLSKTASESVTIAGNQLTYTLSALNRGPSAALQVKITDTLPAAVRFVSASAGCTEDAGVVTCEQAVVERNQTASFDITVEVPTDVTGLLTNKAAVTSSVTDPDETNNSASADVRVETQLQVLDPITPPDPDVWSKPIITDPPCGSSFMGEYNNETVTLTLDNLPQHTLVTVYFDLLILRSWDGNYSESEGASDLAAAVEKLQAMGKTVKGPDQWSFTADGKTLLNTTFSNWDVLGFRQAYPGQYPGGDYPARTGAFSTNSLCYSFDKYEQDSVYHMRFTIPHTADTLTLDFAAKGLQEISDESWGLDNVSVSVSSGADLTPYQTYFPIMGR